MSDDFDDRKIAAGDLQWATGRIVGAIEELTAAIGQDRDPYLKTMTQARLLLASLTAEQRDELFSAYCRGCGSADKRCTCQKDE